MTDAGDSSIAPVAAGPFVEPSEESRAPARVRRFRETVSVEPPKTFALLRIAALRRIYSPSLAPSASIIKRSLCRNDALLPVNTAHGKSDIDDDVVGVARGTGGAPGGTSLMKQDGPLICA